MESERYPGEQRGLRLFLSELRPVVERLMGRNALLLHRIERSLRNGDLVHLRNARQMFNNLPSDLKQRISLGMCSVAEPAPSKHDILDSYSRREPRDFVRFDAAAGNSEPPSVKLCYELLDRAPVRALIRPGTLPSRAAAGLRAIADMIEQDRRLLSQRHWHEDDDTENSSSTADRA